MRTKLAAGIFGLLSLAAGCAEHRVAGPPPAQSTARAGDPVPASASASAGAAATARTVAEAAPAAPAAPPAQELTWIDAVRLERWADAAARIDALPEVERGRPEVRYVRARAALALGDAAKAASLLHRLDAELPLLAADITRWRAEAALEAGPHAEAAAHFARSKDPRDLARAAEAYLRAGDFTQAIGAAGRAVAAAQRSKRRQDEAAARLARARALRQAVAARAPQAKAPAPPAAIADLRWIARSAPATPEGREAAAALAELGAALTPVERLEAADALIEGGSAAEAAAELTRLAATGVLPKPELLHRRATALYRARDYGAAATAFLEAAAIPTPKQPEQVYYAARALARQDRHPEAIERLLEVASKWPRTSWAEGATFLAAQLMLQTGRYDDAAKQYARFLDRFPRSDRRDEAEHERALALISSGDAAGARAKLGRLSAQARRIDDASRLRQLEGLAALRAGDRAAALQIWTDVMRTYPLSWGALTSRARLAAEGAAVPPLLEPPAPGAAPPLAVSLPPAAALLASVGLDADAERWITDNEREVAAAYGPRGGEALCTIYGTLSRAKRRYRVGVNAVGYDALKRAPSEAERWAWECVYPRPYLASVRGLEDEHGMPRGLIYALMRQESAFDPVVVSPASAVGLMQLMPSTAERAAREMEMGLDLGTLKSPEVNLKLGSFYLAKLLRIFEGSLPLATAAYNAGPKAVSRWLPAGAEQDTDLWVARIPYGETRHYVGRVLGNLARYQWLEGGEGAVTMVPLTIPTGIRAPDDAY